MHILFRKEMKITFVTYYKTGKLVKMERKLLIRNGEYEQKQ